MIWRRSFDIPPPDLEENDQRHPKFDRKYKDVDPALLPRTEVIDLLMIEFEDNNRQSFAILE